MIPLDVIPTGWFHVGWSAEIAPGGVKPMRYFGQDLVAFRSSAGRLSVLDAHCRHLGAHLGYGGRVRDDCVICPYHGWSWDADGRNVGIPYQDKPVNARQKVWAAQEKHGMMFVWHDPEGGPPRQGWELPDLFADFEGLEVDEDSFYPCYPNAVVNKPDEPIHPQLIMENTADCMHFRHTHGAPEDPAMLWFRTEDIRWLSSMGFTSPKTKAVALRTYVINPSVGLSYTIFDGRQHYRLLLSCTPVDATRSDLRVSYFFPRGADGPAEMPESLRAFARHTVDLFEEDARIWRRQIFVQRPIFAAQDVEAYSALRRWSAQFYEKPVSVS